VSATYDLEVEQGAMFLIAFEYRNSDGDTPTDGTPVDLSGYKPRMQVRLSPGGPLLASFDENSGLTIEGNVITLRIGADVSSTLSTARYDIELYRPDDPADVLRLVSGAVHVDPEVTTDDV
jgi:hypothetical protein